MAKCAVVDNATKTVINIILADPAVDSVPGATLIAVDEEMEISPHSFEYSDSTGKFSTNSKYDTDKLLDIERGAEEDRLLAEGE